MKTQPNEPATGYGFATLHSRYEETGLTKREYFAALAMQGILSGKIQVDSMFVADYSVECADELIEALNKK